MILDTTPNIHFWDILYYIYYMPVKYVKEILCVYFLHLLEMDTIAGYCDFTKFLMRNHFILLLYKLP